MPVASPDRAIRQEGTMRAVTGKVEVAATAPDTSKRSAEFAVNYHVKKAEGEEARDSLDRFASGNRAPAEIPDRATSVGVIEKHADNVSKPLMKEMDGMMQGLITGDRTSIDKALLLTATPVEKQALQETIIAPFEKVLREMGADIIIDELNTGTPEEVRANWVKYALEQVDANRSEGDNRVVDALRENYAAFMGKDRGVSEVPLEKAELEKARYENQIKTKDRAIKQNGTELKDAQKLQDSYNKATPTEKGGILQKLVEDVKLGSGQYGKDKAELQKTQASFDLWKTQVAGENDPALKASLLRDPRSRLGSDIATLQGKVDTHDALVAERDSMANEKASLPDKIDDILDKGNELEMQKIELKDKLRATGVTIDQINNSKAGGEMDFGKGFGALTGDAFKEAMIGRITAERAAINTSIDIMIAAETDPHVKAVLDNLKNSNNRWTDWEDKWGVKRRLKILPTPGKKEHEKFEKKTAEEDMRTLLSGEHGREDFMKRFLSTTKNPDTGLFYTPPERDAMIADKAFMEKAAPKAIAMLVRQAHQNGILKASDIAKLSDSEWGEEAFHAALAFDKDKKAMMEKESKKNGFAKIEDFYGKHKKLSWWIMLTAISPVAGAVVGGGVLTKNILSKGSESVAVKKEGGHEPAKPHDAPPAEAH